jgi:uncharacterized protein YecT (DUF1311 family)
MKKYITAFAILITTTYLVNAQDSMMVKIEPVDKQLNACLDSTQNQTTAGMLDCEGRAKTGWDKELNKYYRLIMATLSADEKEKLKTSQVSWLTYRDNESTFFSTMYNNMEGTMWQTARAHADVEITKQRALELKFYYEDRQNR